MALTIVNDSCILKHDHWPVPVCVPSDVHLAQRKIKMDKLKQHFTVP